MKEENQNNAGSHQSYTAVVVPAEEARSTVGIEPCAGVRVVEFTIETRRQSRKRREKPPMT